jgi:hypothetical protein
MVVFANELRLGFDTEVFPIVLSIRILVVNNLCDGLLEVAALQRRELIHIDVCVRKVVG